MTFKILAVSTDTRESSGLNSNYEPPLIEVIEVSVEKGFADSANDFGEGAW